MTDVFDRLLGQERAAEALRQYATRPVHAYLFTGPAGTSVHDALESFAAALQCPDHGCGVCESCQRVLRGADPDVTFLERAGVNWRVDDVHEAERISRRRPLGSGYQIVVLEDVELTLGSSPAAPALLKSLEEPPSRTIFLLSASELPEELATIMSRCVEVRLRPLRAEDLEQILVRDGADPTAARVAAQAASGNLRRARVLVNDSALARRIAQWREVPERLNGTPAGASAVVSDIVASLNDAVAPLVALQEAELARRIDEAREFGQRTVTNRKEIEAQFKREQRRFRIDDLRFGLSALTNVYRERLRTGLDAAAAHASGADRQVRSAIGAIEHLAEASRRLSLTIDEALLLNDLMLSLSGL